MILDVDASVIESHFIANEEGKRLRVYKDTAGYDTIGIGHKVLKNEHFPHGITEAECDTLFRHDISIAVTNINHWLFHPKLNKNQATALASLVLNCGAEPLAHTPGKLIKQGKLAEAAEAFLLYHHDHGPGHPCTSACTALLERRKRERDLFNKPV